MPATPPKLLARVRATMRARHMSPRTEAAYASWIRRYIRYHGVRHPQELDDEHVVSFLTYLAAEQRVARSTQVQALSALTLLYADVLKKPLGDIRFVIRSTTPARLPVVLTRDEVRSLLSHLEDGSKLIATLLYGSGLRIAEAITLRVKDLDLDSGEIRVRRGKGAKDRVTMLPESALTALGEHLGRVKSQHDKDLRSGGGRVQLPGALEKKSPSWATNFGWQWVFPAIVATGTRRPARSDDTICTKASSNAPSKPQCAPQELRSTPPATPSAIPSRRTYWRTATTSGRFRSFSAIRT